MKKIILLFLFTFIISCSGVKRTQSLISDGNYDGAINRSVDALKNNKNAKGKQDYVYLIEEAFAKAKERDHRNVEMFEKEGNPANFEKIYNIYLQLNDRQERIRPLLPLFLIKENRNAIFPLEDYSSRIISSRENLSKYLYDNSKSLMKHNDKMSYRQAYDDFSYLKQINPNYRDIKNLMDECYFKGLDFVHVYTKNETNMIIPVRLNKDLLDFSTYGLNDKWTVYHNNKQKDIKYDFAMSVSFREIIISPEKMIQREFVKEKQVKDGTKPKLDANGNQMKDDKGNVIMEDVFKTIRATVYEHKQEKVCNINAKVDYIDLKRNQLIESFPLSSQFIFEYIYSTYNGDRNACDTNYFEYFNRRAMPFPTSEQMVFDTGEDLKSKLKTIINNNKFRRK